MQSRRWKKVPGQIENLKLKISACVSGASVVIQHISAQIRRQTKWELHRGATQQLLVSSSLNQGDRDCLSASWSRENDLTRPERKNIQMSNYQTIADPPEFPPGTITWSPACSHTHWKGRRGESGTPTTLIVSMILFRTHWDKNVEVVLQNCIPTECNCVDRVCVAFRLQKYLSPCQMCHAPSCSLKTWTPRCPWMVCITPDIKLRSLLLKTPSVGCRVFAIYRDDSY